MATDKKEKNGNHKTEGRCIELSRGEVRHAFCLYTLMADAVEAALSLQEAVLPHIKVPGLFQPLSREELLDSVRHDTLWGLYDGESMVALCMLVHNRDTDRSLAPDAGRPNAACITFDGVLVHPEYRGFGIQRLFLSLAAEKAATLSAGTVLATVAPENKYSRQNFSAAGFSVLREYEKYGYPRLLVGKEV